MRLFRTNLTLFAYDPNKDKNTNYAAQMQAILDKGEKNLTATDYKNLAALEKAANEKVAYLDQTGTNKWGATQSSKYQDAYASIVSGGGGSNKKDDATGGSGAGRVNVHYTPPTTPTAQTLASAASEAAATPATYTPIDTSGVDWDKMYLTNSQYKQVQAYGQAYTAAMEAGNKELAQHYHELAEGIRAQAPTGGYSGGGDGSQYLPFPIEEVPEQQMDTDDRWNKAHQLAGLKPSYDPRDEIAEQNMDTQDRYDMINELVDEKPGYDSRWDETKMALAQAYLAMNYDDFLKSSQYQALENRYGLQGKNAMQNVLGQVASRTGGLASSYTSQVANQTYNDYMSQLSAAAYDMYRSEANDAYNKAMAAYGYDDSDYGRYLDELAQWNVEHGYATDAFDKALAQANYNREWDRGLYESDLSQWNKDYSYAVDAIDKALAQSNYNQEWDYKVTQASKADAMDRIQSYLSTGGMVADLSPSLIEASGYTQAELLQLQSYYQSLLNPAGSGGTRYLRPSSPTKETPLSAGAAEGAAGGALSGMIYVRNGGYYTKNEMEDLIKQGKVQAKTSSDGTVYFDYVFGSGGGNR